MASADSILLADQSSPALLHKRNAWGLADQVLISGTNFVTMILVVKGLHDAAAFGTFTLVYSAMLFCNMVQTGLVCQPHNVIGTARRQTGDTYRSYTTATALVQILLVAVAGLAAGLVAIGAHLSGAVVAPLLISLVPSIIAWQLQEFCRRVLYTEGRLLGAFLNDVISYGGQTALIAWLWFGGTLTSERVMYALAATSAVAAAVGAWQLRSSLSRHIDRSAIIENWHFGKWLAASDILSWCSSLQFYLFLSALILGTAASAMLRAAQILFGPARVLAFFLQSILPIRFARTLVARGDSELNSEMRRAYQLVVATLGPYCLLMACFPTFVLTKVFEPQYADNPQILQLYAFSSMMSYLALVMTAAFSAKRMTREIFISNACGTAVALALSWILIKTMGVVGAVACIMISTIVMVSMLGYRFRRRMRPNVARLKQPAIAAARDSAERVIIATIKPPNGNAGMQLHTRALWEGLERAALECDVVDSSRAGIKWIPVFAFGKLFLQPLNRTWGLQWHRHWHYIALRQCLRRQLLRQPARVVVAQCPVSARAALDVHRMLGAKFNVTMVCHFNFSEAAEYRNRGDLRDETTYQRIINLEKWALRRVDQVVFASNWARHVVEVERQIRPRQSCVIWNGIATDAQMASLRREAIGLTADDLMLINVGSLEPQKNQLNLLDLFALIRKQNSRAKLVLIGDGPQRNEIEAKIHRCGLSDSVFLLGQRADVPSLLQLADIYVHYSLLEGCPAVVLEAERAGLPVAALSTGGITKLNGRLGSLVQLNALDSEASLAALRPLLDNLELRHGLRQEARRGFEANFTPESMVSRFLEAPHLPRPEVSQ